MSRLRTTIYCAAIVWATLCCPAGPLARQQPPFQTLEPSDQKLTPLAGTPDSTKEGAKPSPQTAKPNTLFESRLKLMLPDNPVAPPGYDAANAYIPLRGGKLAAIALQDGRPAWTIEIATTVSPAAGEGLVFVASEKELRALAAVSGREEWRLTLDDPPAFAPLFDTGWLIVGQTNGEVVTLRAKDGQVLWRRDLGSPLRAPPAAAGARVYFPLDDGRIVAADLHTGKPAWTRSLGGPPAEILALDDRLFVGSDDNFLYCLALKDGKIKWHWRTGGDISGAPIVDETRVYFMSRDNMLRAADRGSGSLRWQRAVPVRTVGGPLRSGSLIAVASLASQLHAYHSADGMPAGSSPAAEGEALSNAVIAAPYMTLYQGREAFVLVTRQGILEILAFAEGPEEKPRENSKDKPAESTPKQ